MAEKRRISITQALSELKLLDSRINKAIYQGDFIGATKKSSDSVGNTPRATFESNAKADYQSIIALIENRAAIKDAIVKSNAETMVEVNGVTYTVAGAIERKNSIEYERSLLDVMKSQYHKCDDTVRAANAKVDAQLDRMLETYIGKDTDKKIAETDFQAITAPYRAQNEWELVDPLGLLEKINKLDEEIDNFMSTVDTALVISNSVTYIEV